MRGGGGVGSYCIRDLQCPKLFFGGGAQGNAILGCKEVFPLFCTTDHLIVY